MTGQCALCPLPVHSSAFSQFLALSLHVLSLSLSLSLFFSFSLLSFSLFSPFPLRPSRPYRCRDLWSSRFTPGAGSSDFSTERTWRESNALAARLQNMNPETFSQIQSAFAIQHNLRTWKSLPGTILCLAPPVSADWCDTMLLVLNCNRLVHMILYF